MNDKPTYWAGRNYCDCHPETCCCFKYAVYMYDEKIETHHSLKQAEKKAKFYNEVGRHE